MPKCEATVNIDQSLLVAAFFYAFLANDLLSQTTGNTNVFCFFLIVTFLPVLVIVPGRQNGAYLVVYGTPREVYTSLG